jgi:hypothetical protein
MPLDEPPRKKRGERLETHTLIWLVLVGAQLGAIAVGVAFRWWL